jgi:hypothetical protein
VISPQKINFQWKYSWLANFEKLKKTSPNNPSKSEVFNDE